MTIPQDLGLSEPTAQLADDVEDRLPNRGLLIDGQWRPALSGETFVTENPATGKPIADVGRAAAADVDLAVSAARRALNTSSWATGTPSQRGRALIRLAALVDTHREELARLESLDGGKPIAATRRQDLSAVIDCLEYYAGWADKITGTVIPVRPDALTYTKRQPVGVVAAIVPWNFPLMNAVWKLAPALACGCAVILKPAELTPLTALRLGELALEAGIPPGILNILPGFGHEAGAALVSHPGIDKISFTGSPGVGREIMRSAATHVVRVGLELGGKSPSIIFDGTDLDAAAAATSSGCFFNAGQVCSAAARVLVEDRVYDEFVARFIARAERIVVGDPLQEATRMGPLISARQFDRVQGYVDAGRAGGSEVLLGGDALERPGHFMPPTVFGDVRTNTDLAQDEIFGPVASIIRFRDEDDALAIANASRYSLAGAVWTESIAKAHRVADRLRAGTVWINTYGPTDTRLPWGGWGGDSGTGRDLGEAALSNYTDTKTVWLKL